LSKVVLLTGGSKGIGYAAAKSFYEKGCKIYELSRHEVANPGVVHITGDVTDKPSVEAAVNSVIAREGRIDVLVCSAGTVLSGAVEFTDILEVRKLMDVNFFGMVNAVQTVLPHMRKTGGGRIVCISSVAGTFPVHFQTYYSVSKAAINAFTFALATEVKNFGIGVCAVMPPDTKTDPIRLKLHEGDDIYEGRIERAVHAMERDEENGLEPDYTGGQICKIALQKRIKPYYVITLKYKFLVFLKRVFTSKFAQFVIGKMYS
jgi:NAD(P)-dependent dehydrogenase (short-subunit alcohol dehydrogenase family)